MKNYFVQSRLSKIAKMLANRYGLVVKFTGGSPRTDGTTITLPAVSDELSEEEQRDLLAYIVHECSHILFTEMSLAESFTKAHGRKAFEMLNALEDARIERLIEKEYVGAKRLIDECAARLTKNLEEKNKCPDSFRQFVSMLYLLGRGYQIPSNWDDSIKNKAEQFIPEIKEAVYGKTTSDVGKVVLRILSVLTEELEKDHEILPHPDHCSNASGGGESGHPDNLDDDSNTTTELGDTVPSSSSITTKGDVSAGCADRDTPDTSAAGQNINVFDMDDTGEAVNQHERLIKNISQKCDELLSFGDKSVFRRYDSSIDIYERIKDANAYKVLQHENEIRPYVNAVRSKLLSALISQGQTRWISNQDIGDIDSNRIPALLTGSSDKVFKRRVTGKSKQTSITMLVDTSQSMNGNRIHVARLVAMVFADVLSRANIKSRVIGFDGSDQYSRDGDYRDLCESYSHIAPVRYSLLKDFHEPYKAVKARFPHLSIGGITPLAPALIQEIQTLLEQKTDRRILFVLTDGDPNSDTQIPDHHCRAMCKDLVAQAEKAGVEVLGLGIGIDVSAIFPRNVQISELNDLPKVVLRQLHSLLVNTRV